MDTQLILPIVAALAFVYAIVIYNRLVTLRNRVRNGYAQIDVQLQRRYDLIPNLVESAKTYLAHERDTLEAVIAARNQARDRSRTVAGNPLDGDAMGALIAGEGVLHGALGHLFAVAEAYPELKADQSLAQLNDELSATENRIAFARQAYNDAVMHFNTQVESFPDLLIAGPTRFAPATLWRSDDDAVHQAPRIHLR